MSPKTFFRNKRQTILLALLLVLISVFSALLITQNKAIKPKAETTGATIALNPGDGSFSVNDIISVDILVNTNNTPVYTVDIDRLNYDPVYLEVIDEDSAVSGIQIKTNNLFTEVVYNSVAPDTGKISLSVNVGPSSDPIVVNGAIATVKFKVKAAKPKTELWFDTEGTHRCGVYVMNNGQAVNILSSASGALFNLFGTTPTLPTVDLKANGSDNPVNISSGESANLTWTSTNAASCTASGDWSGNKETSGSESTGALTSSKTYTLTCMDANNKTAVDSIQVNVVPPMPVVSLKANGNSSALTVVPNTEVQLAWTSASAENCSATGDWSGNKQTSGSESLGKLTESKTYTLTCTNSTGQKSDTVVVTVSNNLPTVNLKANSKDGVVTINAGDSVSLSWTSGNANSCEATGHWSGSKETSGSLNIGKVGSSKQYILTCKNNNGDSATDEVLIHVNNPEPASPAANLKINNSDSPVTINSGAKVTLSWTSSNASTCTASNGWSGTKALSGSEEISNITSAKSFTLTCSKSGKSANDTVSANIASQQADPTVDLKINSSNDPVAVTSGESVTLSWNSSNASSCTASNGWSGEKGTYGYEKISNITSAKTFTITCVRGDKKASDSVSVKTNATSGNNGNTGENGGNGGIGGGTDNPVNPDNPIVNPPTDPNGDTSTIPPSSDEESTEVSPTGMQNWALWLFYAIIPISITIGAIYYYIKQKNKKNKKEEEQIYPF